MLTPGLYVWANFVNPPADADTFEVIGKQWSWSYRFPGEDGAMGTIDTRHISSDNPFGMNPDDPNGQDDILIDGDDLHLPIDMPVKVLLRSLDVLHDFYVPEFRAKMDLGPGMVTFFWFTPTRTGTYDILCFELCGIGHYAMRSLVVVEEESAYQEWLQEQSTFAQSLAQAGNGPGDPVQPVLSEADSVLSEADSAEKRLVR
jgi:cytochrome c oxidase subunit 2